MTPRARRILVAAGLFVAVCALAAGATFVFRHRPNLRRIFASRPSTTNAAARAPQGQRVKVEVINATTVHGLARRAMEFLRDQGFDVVQTGTTSELRDSTIVLDRSGHPDWAHRIATALGNAHEEARPDSSHYVDATVLLGASWHPPATPFRP